ncbi:MAG: polysaccharide biosynthesis protein PslG [Thermoleophilaceae bacterium]|nr:polysaccharide biosynthesis protein PslG [Thermoleophilaceae bacterium]
MARRALVAAALAAALGLAACGGDSSEDEAPAPRPLLGVTSGALLDERAPLASEVRAMKASGVTTLRAPFYWWTAEPKQGRPPSFAATDRLVAETARAQIELLPVVLGTPSWAARHPELGNSPPAGTEDYARFLAALIGRYGPDGSFWAEHGDVPEQPIRSWQLWNEPDHLHYWSDQPYQRDYVRLARAARAAIKAADPGARVVMAGFADRSWDSIAAVYGAGAKGVFDAVAIHPYTFEVRDVLRIVRYARRELRRAGDPGRPLWLTEVTWSSGRRAGHPARPFETTEPDQAARLGRALPLLLRTRRELGVERIFWENWISTDSNHDNPFDFSGLRVLDPDGTVSEKPAYAVFKRIALRQR